MLREVVDLRYRLNRAKARIVLEGIKEDFYSIKYTLVPASQLELESIEDLEFSIREKLVNFKDDRLSKRQERILALNENSDKIDSDDSPNNKSEVLSADSQMNLVLGEVYAEISTSFFDMSFPKKFIPRKEEFYCNLVNALAIQKNLKYEQIKDGLAISLKSIYLYRCHNSRTDLKIKIKELPEDYSKFLESILFFYNILLSQNSSTLFFKKANKEITAIKRGLRKIQEKKELKKLQEGA